MKIGSLLLNVMYVLFPIFCYLLYAIYQRTVGKKENNLFFDLSLVSSMYLLLKYGSFENNIYNVFFINVLLIVSLIEKRNISYIFISMYVMFYYYQYYSFNPAILIFEYLIFFLIYIVNRRIKNIYLIAFFCIISFLFNLIKIDYSYLMLIHYIIIFLVSDSLIFILNKSKDVMDLNVTIKKLEKEKSLRDSIFKITHEIKNPIAVCKGYLDMLDTNNTKQVNRYIPIINQEINRTLTLMSDFLDLNKLKINRSNMDVIALIDDICCSVETLIVGNKIEFEYINKYNELYIYGDYDGLKQVLINMIKNSIEAIGKKENGKIILSVDINSKYIILKIIDNGIGMNKETLKRVGESFFSTKQNGTGLGVKLSKEIIEQHDGSIKYESKEGIGTTVIIKMQKK